MLCKVFARIKVRSPPPNWLVAELGLVRRIPSQSFFDKLAICPKVLQILALVSGRIHLVVLRQRRPRSETARKPNFPVIAKVKNAVVKTMIKRKEVGVNREVRQCLLPIIHVKFGDQSKYTYQPLNLINHVLQLSVFV